MKPRFPKKLDKAFLLVDLLNNLDSLAENKSDVLANAEQYLSQLEVTKLQKTVSTYGAEKTKKKVLSWLNKRENVSL
jgi:hypothetical protein